MSHWHWGRARWAAGILGVAVVIAPLSGASAAAPEPSTPSVDLLVGLRPGTSPAHARVLERDAGTTYVRSISQLGVEVVSVPAGRAAAALGTLRRDARVAFAESDHRVQATDTTPNDPGWPNQWSLPKVRAPLAWDTTTGSPSVVVAVLDTGVDSTQPDLQGAPVPGRDVVNNDADPTDDHGHGTYVAGIAGARGNNALGVASLCWSCAVMPVKVLGADGTGSYSNVAAGITWATDHGARVITMSLGGAASSTTLSAAVDYARQRDVVVVASAGNDGTTTPNYPAAIPGVLSVAGSDANDARYSWSTYGSWVALTAPGCNLTTGRSGWYGTFCGTSSSTPVVAGIAGLARSAAPSASGVTVEQALRASAVPVGYVASGRVDAAGTIARLGSSSTTTSTTATSTTTSTTATSTTTTAPSTTLTTSFSGSLNTKTTSRTYSVTAGAGPLSAALTFTKAPSLTLTVRAADGTVIAQASGSSVLRLAPNVARGTYQLVVSGTASASFTLTVTTAI